MVIKRRWKEENFPIKEHIKNRGNDSISEDTDAEGHPIRWEPAGASTREVHAATAFSWWWIFALWSSHLDTVTSGVSTKYTFPKDFFKNTNGPEFYHILELINQWLEIWGKWTN